MSMIGLLWEAVDPVVSHPYSQISILALTMGTLVVVVRWMMQRIDKTIDGLTKAVDEFRTVWSKQVDFQADVKELLAAHAQRVEHLIARTLALRNPQQRRVDEEERAGERRRRLVEDQPDDDDDEEDGEDQPPQRVPWHR